jgi:hypothetical protein
MKEKNKKEKVTIEDLALDVKNLSKTVGNLVITVKNGFEQMATKEELKLLATKEELKLLATKEDLKLLATKEELKTLRKETREEIEDLARMTAQEFSRINTKMDNGFENIIEEIKGEFERAGSHILETNDRIDFLSETRIGKEHFNILKGRVDRIEKRLKIAA